MKKFISLILTACMLSASAMYAAAEFIEVNKVTDSYALRANGELVRYRDAENNLPQRIAVDVADFNNSAYITNSGGLFSMDGTVLADDAKSLAEKAVYINDGYNGEYVYISKDGSLKMPAANGFGGTVLCENVLKAYGNLVVKTDGKAAALLTSNGTVTAKDIVDNAVELSGEDGEYLVLDENRTCWFVPLLKGAFAYGYETLKLDENVTSCKNLDTVLLGNEWSEYDRSALRAGKVAKNLKSSNALFVYGDYIYVNTGRSFCVYYNKENALMQNTREASQYKHGSMNGYVLDQADTLYRNEQNGNKLVSTEVAFPMYSIVLTGDGWCIAKDQDGMLYGVDKAAFFGTGTVSENAVVTSVALPINMKTVRLYMNGAETVLKHRIIDKEGRTMYPLREMAELLGAEVGWDENSKTATVSLNGNTVRFTINQSAYEVNGETKFMDTVPVLDELTESTYIPLRFAAESLGFSVDWTPGEYENTINVNG